MDLVSDRMFLFGNGSIDHNCSPSHQAKDNEKIKLNWLTVSQIIIREKARLLEHIPSILLLPNIFFTSCPYNVTNNDL